MLNKNMFFLLVSLFGSLSLTTASVIDCGTKYVIPHGIANFTKRDTSLGKQVPVKCDKGYRTQGDTHITCLKTGNWSTNTKCVVIDCGKDHSVPNGFADFKGKDTTFNHTVQVYCNEGFRTLTSPYIKCLDDGTWSTDTICHPIDCGEKYSIPNGQVEYKGRSTYVHHKVPVKCKGGFKIQGDKELTCLPTGSWSTGTSCAIIDCGNNFAINHGRVDYNGKPTTYGHTLPVICEPGYKIHGKPVVTCMSDGTWSSDSSCTLKDCGTTYSLPNGHVDFNGHTTTYNSIVPVSCDKGYQQHGEQHITCLHTGEWSRTTQCLPTVDCGTKYDLENGYANFTGQDTTYNHRVEVTCNDGYKVVGDHYISCLANGSWTKSTACRLVDCGTKFSISHGFAKFSERDTTYKALVPIACNKGYDLKGDEHITCLENGQWSKKTSCQVRKCSGLYTIENGNVDLTGRSTIYGQVAPVSCAEGFEIHGDPFITCLADGTWSTDTSCSKKDCGTEYRLENGHVDFKGNPTTVGEKFPLFCDPGFEIEGDTDTICLLDGTWSKLTKCRRKDCGTKYTIEHGYADFIGKTTTFNNTVPIVCDAGYDLIGDPYTTCQSDGAWSQNTVCRIKDCGSNYTLAFGYVEFRGVDTTYGSKVEVDCDPGYSIQGDYSVTCLADGTWSRNTVCKVKDCGRIYDLDNGRIDFAGRQTTYNEKIPVTCDDGFDVQGDYEITCLEDGTWSKFSFCKIRDCGSEYVLENGYIEFSGKSTTFNSSIPVTCSDGYKNQGEDHVFCQANGTWTKHTACQIRDCGARYNLDNGQVDFTGKGTTYNAIVPVTCSPGYETKGDDFITCQSNGQWSSTECLPKDCGTSYPLANGHADFEGHETTFDQTVPVVCDAGYKIQGEGYIRCLPDGQWSKSSRCHIKDCGTEYTLDHGFASFDGKKTTFDQKVPVICNKGYEILGEPEITCLATGQWSNYTTCHIEDCGNDHNVENGNVNFTGRSTKYNHKVPVTCNTGYDLVGPHEITCKADGSWTDDTVCQIKDCGKDYALDGGIVHFDGHKTTYKSQVPISCLDGYDLVGKDSTTCLATGKWDKTSSCKPKDCGSTYLIDNGHVDFTDQDTTFKNKVLVICDTGYENDGPQEITCQADGTWSKDSTCRIKDCGTSLVIQNGQVNFAGHNTVYNSTVPISCNEGYDLHGDTLSTCLDDGSWSQKTTCVIKDCGNSYELDNGFLNFDDVETTFGNTISVTCEEGYVTEGEPHITCLATGAWSTKTHCRIVDCGSEYELDHGSVDFDKKQTTYNQTAKVKCTADYEAVGTPEIVCLSNGTWSQTVCQRSPAKAASSAGPVVGGVVGGLVAIALVAVIIIMLRKNQKLCFAKTSILEREFGDLENEQRVTM